MKSLFLGICFTLFSAATVFAQGSDGYKKAEFFVGYSNGQVATGFDEEDLDDERASFNGFNASAVVNVSKYFGLKADVSGTYKKQRFDFAVSPGQSVRFDADSSLYNFLGGVQIKNNSNEGTIKPFVHALVGAGRVGIKVDNVSCPPGVDCSFITARESETGFAGAFGGGIDFRVGKRVQIRAIQIDYNPVRLDGTTLNNFRIGAGMVFEIGNKKEPLNRLLF